MYGGTWNAVTEKSKKRPKSSKDAYQRLLSILRNKRLKLGPYHEIIKITVPREKYFDSDNRRSWPVQALMTLGSPIGLSMFGRDSVQKIGEAKFPFRWINIWDPTDPVVTGSFYGKPEKGYKIVEDFSKDTDSGWSIQDRKINTGYAWLKAHLSYWSDPTVGDELITMVSY